MEESTVNDIPVVDGNLDDDFDAVADEIINENNSSSNDLENNEETTSTEESGENTNSNEESSEKEIDFKPFLDYLSKNVKYNKESMNVDNIESVISNFQKGLNYDKLQDKINNLENGKALTYINKKSQELGMTVDEYMEQVENYEQEQQKQKDAERLEEMVNNGVPEDLAKEVIATGELRRQLQEEKNKLAKEKQDAEAKSKKDKEYEDFVNEFPNVKAEDIPQDVFLNANNKGISLLQAYKDYQFAEMKKELSQLKQNQENSKRSVGSTTERNDAPTTSKKSSDLFLQGFDEG